MLVVDRSCCVQRFIHLHSPLCLLLLEVAVYNGCCVQVAQFSYWLCTHCNIQVFAVYNCMIQLFAVYNCASLLLASLLL